MRRVVHSVVTGTLAVLVMVSVSMTNPSSALAATVPNGFLDAEVAPFSQPTAVEVLPGGRLVVVEQGGRIKVGDPGGPFVTAIDLAGLCAGGERGALGFTHDPAFLSNGFVYVYYTRDAPGFPNGCVNRVSRFTLLDSSIAQSSEVVLIDNISSRGGNHNGGDLDIGSDGFLYVSVGDAGTDPRGDSGSAGGNDAAQDLSLLNGKILRITLDGQPAPGNPLTGPGTDRCATRGNLPSTPATACQELFAWGLRNPYRFAFDRNDGSDRFFINDVGQGTLEEVDVGQVGANYGWPMREGGCPRGQTHPCAGPPAGLTDPITDYGRGDGHVITGGAFIPNGLWPGSYDGAYFFADAFSGDIWVRYANGSLDYGAPFASAAGSVSDMTFGFDAQGRMVLYYVQTGGGLRSITPTSAPASGIRTGLRTIPVTPFRAYDTGPSQPAVGVAPGVVFNGTTRRIDLDPPGAYDAALVNVTFDASAGAGYVRLWATGALRPQTSSLNADAAGMVGANSAIVPLDSAGRFMLESTLTGRVIIDVMAWLDDSTGPVSAGRFEALPPLRLVDTREPGGVMLESGSDNPYSRAGTAFEFTPAGRVGIPGNGQAAAAVLSIAALAGPGSGGWIGAHPSGTAWAGNSNVNVVGPDVRANLVVVPLGTGGRVRLEALNIADVVVDVVGYITSGSAPASTVGLYSAIEPVRVVDTRVPLGLGRMTGGAVATLAMPVSGNVTAMVQNITVVDNSGAGWVATFPESGAVPLVSNLNYMSPGQIRAALAFTVLPASDRLSYLSLVDTNLVVDVIGTFS